MAQVALIVGAGVGLSASLARLFAAEEMSLALASRNPEKISDLAADTRARLYNCEASDAASVDAMFAGVEADLGVPDVVVYNPSYRVRGPLVQLDRAQVRQALEITAYGGFLVGQAAAVGMLTKGSGAILFTGASASVKGYAQSAPFAMGKFALRGLAQSMAREFQPKNIHVAHFVIDGGIRSATRKPPEDRPDGFLDPDSIAHAYLDILRQHRSAWTWEIELRPWLENF